ncbi:MAG: ABC transporter permease, partial [Agromyces sp.]
GNPDETARVVSQPVTVSKEIQHPLASLRDLIAMLVLPAALWIGALAIVIARRPFRAEALQSTRGTARIVARSTITALGFGALQVALALAVGALVGLPVATLGWGAAIGLVASFSFITLHTLGKLLWPRVTDLASIVLLVVQFVALPCIVPVEMLPEWMQPLANAFPLSWATQAMQAAVSGEHVSTMLSRLVALALLGAAATAVTTLVLSRRRLARGFGFAIATAN